LRHEVFKASKANLQKQLDTIKQQQLEIQSLSAPIIDVGDDVVAVPLTGVEHLDSHLVDRLVRLAAAVRLLGAACLTTGMSPRVALALVSLGGALEGFVSFNSLKDGLRYCRARAGHT
jgi:rsbT co-antagonist protein RsbR